MRREVLGAVLAGGASSRFGSDKAAAVLGGRTLLDQAAAVLAPFVREVVVVGRGVVPDRPVAGLGPLGGIAGVLGHAGANGFASVLTIGCDMPTVPGGLVEALLRQAPAYCADAPVLGHWPADLADELTERLNSTILSPPPCAGVQGPADPRQAERAEPWTPGRARHEGMAKALSVRRWAESIDALAIPAPNPLANVNTPADLAAL